MRLFVVPALVFAAACASAPPSLEAPRPVEVSHAAIDEAAFEEMARAALHAPDAGQAHFALRVLVERERIAGLSMAQREHRLRRLMEIEQALAARRP